MGSTFRQHLDALKAKTTSRVVLIRRLAGTTWGAATKTLRISTQALVYSAAEYCAPVWCRSSHTKGLVTALNSAMLTVSGCLRPTPVNQLPILSGIAPPALRREAAALVLSRKAKTREDHLLHRIATEKPPHARLKSRRPFSKPYQTAQIQQHPRPSPGQRAMSLTTTFLFVLLSLIGEAEAIGEGVHFVMVTISVYCITCILKSYLLVHYVLLREIQTPGHEPAHRE